MHTFLLYATLAIWTIYSLKIAAFLDHFCTDSAEFPRMIEPSLIIYGGCAMKWLKNNWLWLAVNVIAGLLLLGIFNSFNLMARVPQIRRAVTGFRRNIFRRSPAPA